MRRAVVVKQIKDKWGPIMSSVQKTGIDIVGFDNVGKLKNYDSLIVFHNKFIPLLETDAKIGWWMNDLRTPLELLNGGDQPDHYHYQKIFICHNTYNDEYQKTFSKPIYYMPQCGIDNSNIVRGRSINWKISFIGNVVNKKYYHEDREDIIKHLEEKYNVGIISGEGQTDDQQWIYNQTQYNLCMSYPMIGGTSNRLYNILSSKGFALVRHFPEIEKLFTNHKHLVWWKDVKEIPGIIEHYDNNYQAYLSVKENGYKIYNQYHTAKHRLDNMFDILEGKETEFRGYLK